MRVEQTRSSSPASSALGTMKDRGVFLRVDPELVPKLFVVIRANAASISNGYTLDEIAQSAHSLASLSHLKKILMVTVRCSLIKTPSALQRKQPWTRKAARG
jgi:hypothetical protein